MSSDADEIVKRIFFACSPKSIFRRDVVEAMSDAAIRVGTGYKVISSDIADKLIEKGYVKMTLCRDCWKWGTDHCPVGDIWDDDDFCCYGEPKEAKPD